MADQYNLPAPRLESSRSLERTLLHRRSVREFSATALSLEAAGQLLWAAQGITAEERLRTAPSAGALYPLEVYLVAGRVDGLAPGVYRYDPDEHRLLGRLSGDLRARLGRAALGQAWVGDAPALIVIGAVPERTIWKYGERGERYVFIEAGHAGQNVLLQAVALDLGATVVGAFDDRALRSLLAMPSDEIPCTLIPVGHPR
jgi:SagB-type dehydrogenase family enzyme